MISRALTSLRPDFDARRGAAWVRRTVLWLWCHVTISAAASASPVFLPPTPPPLGAPLAPKDTSPAATPAAPVELSSYVNDCFYIPLAARLTATTSEGKLTDALRARLDAYHATKVALQTELLAQFDMLRETDPVSRQTAIAGFTREQTPRVAALEETAEALRRDLAGSGLPGITFPTTGSGLLRAAAFFRPELSPAQRRLLRAAALEMDDANAAPTATSSPSATAATGPWFYFSPEGSRIHLPPNLPADLSAKIAAYETQRRALVTELRAAVERSPDSATAYLESLASRQAPALAQLEDSAEDIRRGLAVLQDPGRRPDLPPLSAELSERIAAYRREKLQLQRALLAHVAEVNRRMGPATSRSSVVYAQDRIREAIASFTRMNAVRYAALERNRELIRLALAQLSASAPPPANAPSPSADALLNNYSEALAQWEVWRNYHDYQIAVLQPGLSPEERRLLFDVALEKLAIPLPAGLDSWR